MAPSGAVSLKGRARSGLEMPPLHALDPGCSERPCRRTRHRLQALHRVLHPRRDRRPNRTRDRREQGDAHPRAGQYGHPVRGHPGGQHRPVPGLQRHRRPRAAQDRSHRPRHAQPRPGTDGTRRGDTARFQQYLCAGAARGAGAGPGLTHARGPCHPPRLAPRLVPRVPQPQRWLARPETRLSVGAGAEGPGSRHRLRGDRRRPDRRHGRLRHRRQDPSLSGCGSWPTTRATFPSIRRCWFTAWTCRGVFRRPGPH